MKLLISKSMLEGEGWRPEGEGWRVKDGGGRMEAEDKRLKNEW